jgi:hypothetical protein
MGAALPGPPEIQPHVVTRPCRFRRLKGMTVRPGEVCKEGCMHLGVAEEDGEIEPALARIEVILSR